VLRRADALTPVPKARYGAGVPKWCSAVFGVLVGGCISDVGYPCTTDEHCTLDPTGRCEPATAYCSYEDEGCPSGRRYGRYAEEGVAGSCVASDDDDDDGDTPVSMCGNGRIDEGETCDDGLQPGGTCHPQCVDPGTPLWTVTYDGEVHGEDRGFAVALDPDGETFVIAGLTTTDLNEAQDILVQRYRLLDGALLWTRTHGGDARGDDTGEHVAIDSKGDIVVIGVEINLATGGDVWLRKYDATGEEIWTVTHDEAGGPDKGQGLAIAGSDHIVAVGHVSIDRAGELDTDAWMRRYDAQGNPLGPALVRGEPGQPDEAIDTIADGDAFVVTGAVYEGGERRIWTARHGATDQLQWEDLVVPELPGSLPRGVGLALDELGDTFVAGTSGGNIWLQMYGPGGVPRQTLVETGDKHDEAADVAFVGDGGFIVVGFQGFTTHSGGGDVWVRRYDANATPVWTDVYAGPGGVDKALAVDVDDALSAVVVGYQTVPGQARDVLIRRYAL
jgi:hypothetical protein